MGISPHLLGNMNVIQNTNFIKLNILLIKNTFLHVECVLSIY